MNQPMLIQANEDGQKAIQTLIDVALKAGGLQVLQGVIQILNSIKPLHLPEAPKENPPAEAN